MFDCMVDLETLNNTSNSAIISIGAVVFDPYNPVIDDLIISERFIYQVDIQTCLDIGLTIGGSTIKWWMDQIKENPNLIFNFHGKADIRDMMSAFFNFIARNKVKYLWGNGATFDNMILQDAFKKIYEYGDFPIKYNHHRCFRTIKKLFGNYVDENNILHDTNVVLGTDFAKHDPLHDAIYQAVFLKYIFSFHRMNHDIK